jgi:hypothetical protein
MPHESIARRTARLDRRLLPSRDRIVDALLVVVDHTGEEVLRVGGRWDRLARKYIDQACTPRVVRLEESQLELGRAIGRCLQAVRAGVKKRPRVLIAGGNRGSGKTWFLAGVVFVVMALEFPGDWQFGINITAKQKRECIEAIRAVARPKWIASDISDFRDPRLLFVTDSTVCWLSAQNPRAIRQAGLQIRYVLINEAQDQPETVANNSIAAIRNTGGLVGVATNPPQTDRSDWVASWWTGIEAGELNGEKYFVDNKLNRSIDQDAVPDIAAFLYATNREAGDADAAGEFRLSGPIAYPAFKPLPVARGGHIGVPPRIGWKDITAEVSGQAIESSVGFPFVCGVDFQREPGVVGSVAKIYRDERGLLVLHVVDTIGVRGVEPDFSQALIAAGYSPAHGMAGAPLLLIGDGTGARQNAEHRFAMPPSFDAMRADGWKIIAPMQHWRRGTPWNPLVKDSRAQMHALFENRQILIAPRCAEPNEGFASLIESFRRAKVGPKGGLVEKGQFQHAPDGVRYLCWKFLPRPQPPTPQGGLDMDSFNALRSTKLGWSR